MWAVVPVKDLRAAKQRLTSVLEPAERHALYRAMLQDVLATLAQIKQLDGIALVTKDPDAIALGKPFGARIIGEAENRGHSAAVTTAAEVLCREGASGLLQVPGDVPLVRPSEIEAVLAAHGDTPAVTLVPSHDERGSNCVTVSPPDVIPFLFGDDSFLPHQKAARDKGIEPAILRFAGFGLDIDTPEDLVALMASPTISRAQRYLSESGIEQRLKTTPKMLRAATALAPVLTAS